MRRASSLPVLQFCGQSDQLGAVAGPSSRAAAISTAYHARMAIETDAERDKADALAAALTSEEREELDEWGPVLPLQLPPPIGGELTYADAAHEAPMAFDGKGRPVPYGSPEALVQGTVDMYWIVMVGARKLIVVGDIKKTRWTTTGPESLQLTAYGMGLALKHQADAFLPALYIATEQEWRLGEMVHLDTDDGAEKWAAVVAAAENRGELAPGPHCSNCYSRFGCPAYLVPGIPSDHVYAVLSNPTTATEAERARAVLHAQREIAAAEVVIKEQKEWALRHGGITDPETGKRWIATEMPGRVSFNGKLALAENPELARYNRQGAPYTQMRWGKAPK